MLYNYLALFITFCCLYCRLGSYITRFWGYIAIQRGVIQPVFESMYSQRCLIHVESYIFCRM